MRNYTYSDCKVMCLQRLFNDYCSCQYAFSQIKFNNTKRICFNEDKFIDNDLHCTYSIGMQLSTNSTVLENCDCPIECEKIQYTYSVSVSEYPTLKYSNYLRNLSIFRTKYPNISYEEMRKSVARVEIFYDEMKETIISENIKMGPSELISNLGGTLGLFLGSSFLSLIEFVEIFIQAFLVFSFKNRM